MAGEGKAFNEVRALLSKLDRSIDEARSKRVGPKEPAPVLEKDRLGSRADLDREIGRGNGSTPAKPVVPPSPLQAKRSQYGRAKPLNREDEQPNRAKSENAWKSPKNYDDLTIG
jgi:hypothetical protein